MTDATDASTARPVPRGAGQLSATAAARPREGVAGGVRASWWYSASGLVALIGAGNALVLVPAFARGETEPARAVLIAVLCAVSAGVQLSFMGALRRGMGDGVRNWPVAAAMVVSGAAILALAAPLQWSALPLITAVSLLACLVGGRSWWAAAAVVAGAIAVERIASPDGADLQYPAFALHVVFPPIIWTTVWAWDVVRRVDDARETESRLAVARERLRFAADLHDIQGHTLQVIALKAELAERLLPDDDDRVTAARAQIAEVRTLAADAMAETRQLAQGYRAPELDEELDNARDVLAAAGFDCTVDAPDLPADPAIRAVFGRVLREATTNVLRHGSPGPVDVAIARAPDDSWQLRMGNAVEGGGGPSSSGSDGSGLAGLRKRVGDAGGALSVLHDGPAPASPGAPGRFTLIATIPANRPNDAADSANGTSGAYNTDGTDDQEVPR